MREYGYAGELALSLRWDSASRTKLSSADIKEMIKIAEDIYAKNSAYSRSRLQDAAIVRSIDQFEALNTVPGHQAGDILIKKVFAGTGTLTERLIVGGQGLFQRDHVIHSEGAPEAGRHQFPLMGSATSEHAAVATGTNTIAEADAHGVRSRQFGSDAEGGKYIVFRPANRESAEAISAMATQITAGPEDRQLKYSYFGAVSSSFRSAINKNRRAAAEVESGLRYAQGGKVDKRSMFCSEFAAMCIEMASLDKHQKMALGVNPQAVSPMVLEDLLTQRPDLFTMVGRYEVPPDQAVSQSPAQASVESDDTESVSASTAMFNVAAPAIPAGAQPADKVVALLDSLEARRGLSDHDASDDPIALIRQELGARQRPSAMSPLTILERQLIDEPDLEERLFKEFGVESRGDLIEKIGRMPPEEATDLIDDITKDLILSLSADDAGGNTDSPEQAAAFNIEAFIQAEGFTCHSIPGDGHCMFASITHAAGGELRDAVAADSLKAAMTIRQWVMEKLVDLEPDRIANLAKTPEARSARLGATYLELARGFNVAQPDQGGWGTAYSLPVAAALFDRPIVVIDQNGIGNLYQPDCSAKSLNNGQPLRDGDFKDIVQRLRDEGANPIAIYKSSATHFQSVSLENDSNT